MIRKSDLSIVTCIATCFLAYFFTIPFHEFIHLLTHVLYGNKVLMFSAGAVNAEVPNYAVMSAFDRIMLAGGSASIVNVIVGLILLAVLLKGKLGSVLRVFLIQLMGAHLSEGFGYFMIGGLFKAGDWGNVFAAFPNQPSFVAGMRIILSLIGCAGVAGLFFLLNYMSGYFIKDYEDKKDRMRTAFRLHLLMILISFPIGMIITLLSPVPSDVLNPGIGILYNMVWLPFFWVYVYRSDECAASKDKPFSVSASAEAGLDSAGSRLGSHSDRYICFRTRNIL